MHTSRDPLSIPHIFDPNMSSHANPLTRKGSAFAFIKSKYETGELQATDKPMQIRKKYRVELSRMGITKDIPPQSNFRAFINRVKRDVRGDTTGKFAFQSFILPRITALSLKLTTIYTDGEDLEPDVFALNTRSTLTPSKKRKSFPVAGLSGEQVDSELDESDDDERGLELLLGPRETKLFSLTASWQEPVTLTQRVSVYVHLPAGAEKGDFAIDVNDGGNTLEVTVSWPKSMTDVDMMLRKWMTLPSSHPEHISKHHVEYQAFQKALSEFRQNVNEKITSICRIPLPTAVQENAVSENALAWSNTTLRAVIIRLKAQDISYGLVRNDLGFETV